MKRHFIAGLLGLVLATTTPANADSLPVNPREAAKPTAENSNAKKILASDTNGLYKLEVLRAAWATYEEIGSWKRKNRQLTLWVRVTGTDGAEPPDKNFSLSDYLLDGRIGQNLRPEGRLIVLGSKRKTRRGNLPYAPLEDESRVPAGQAVWRAQTAQPWWPEIYLDWEFLVPGPDIKSSEPPPSLFTGDKRESGQVRRFSLVLSGKDIEPMPTPEQPVVPLETVRLGDVDIEVFLPSVTAERGGVRNTLGLSIDRTGTRIGFPFVRSLADVRSLQHGWTLRAPDGREWRLQSEDVTTGSVVERPNGGTIARGESIGEVSALVQGPVPEGDWLLQVWEMRMTGQKATTMLAIPVAQTADAPDMPHVPELQVIEARYFDKENSLPPRFGMVGAEKGIAFLLRKEMISRDHKFEARFRQAWDNYANAMFNPERITFLRWEEREDGGQKKLYSVWLGILPVHQTPVTSVRAQLVYTDYGVPARIHTFKSIKLK